ncbi:MAG: NYN domain-containing protein [Pseudomonadota bacterium]
MLDYTILQEPSLYQTAAAAIAALVVGFALGWWRRSRKALQLDDISAWQIARQMASELRRIDAFSDVAGSQRVPPNGNTTTPAPPNGLVRVRLFIDLPNFEMNWKSSNRGRARANTIAWRTLPQVLLDELPGVIGIARDSLRFVGAELYESYIPYQLLAMHGEADKADSAYFYRRRRFLETEVAIIPGYSVHIFDRTLKFEDGAPSRNSDGDLQSNEKGVDSGLISHLFSHALADTYDIALLLSEDSDYVPAVRALQANFGKRVIHVGFRRRPHGISGTVWGDIIIDHALSRKLSKPTGWLRRFRTSSKRDDEPSAVASAPQSMSNPTNLAVVEGEKSVVGEDLPELTKTLVVGEHYPAIVRKVSRHGLRLSVENGDSLVRVMPSIQTVEPFLKGQKIEEVFAPNQRIDVKVIGQNQNGNPLISIVAVHGNSDAE